MQALLLTRLFFSAVTQWRSCAQFPKTDHKISPHTGGSDISKAITQIEKSLNIRRNSYKTDYQSTYKNSIVTLLYKCSKSPRIKLLCFASHTQKWTCNSQKKYCTAFVLWAIGGKNSEKISSRCVKLDIPDSR